MNRRKFLTQLGTGCLAASSLLFENPFRPRFRLAQAANGKVLIVIFQKGGCDGLNTVVPYGDPDYYVHRPTIAIAPPDISNPASALDLDGFFGLHPALSGFEELYGAGNMAILPAVHFPNAPRSHFDAQKWMQSGIIGPESNPDGWLNRHIVSRPGNAGLRALGYAYAEDSSLPDSLRGDAIVSSFSDLTTFGLDLPYAEELAMLERLRPIYDQSPDPSMVYSELVHNFGRVVLDDAAIVKNIDFVGYTPANGAAYPDSNLGRSLQQTAQLIKEGVGLEIAALSKHNWDTHDQQGGGNNPEARHYKELRDFDLSITAFYKDLGNLMSDVTILTMTEFGRTARENGSGGTDHGNASAWFAIGPNVNGGIYLNNEWPGLAPAQLNENRDLAYTVDYRDVFAEVLTKHLGNANLSAVLPAHSYTSLGFLPG